MDRDSSFVGESSRRLDRVLARAPGYHPAAVKIVGDAPVKPGDLSLFPSDHFGLLALLRRR